MWTTEQQIKEHLDCWRRPNLVSQDLSLSLSQKLNQSSCPTPLPQIFRSALWKRKNRWEVHFSRIYRLFLSRFLRKESHPLLHLDLRHTNCKIFCQKRKVQRILAAVMSFPMTRSLLALAWDSRSPHSEASCFLFCSRLEPQLRIAPHSCCCVFIIFTCSFFLYMHETLFLYIL